MSTVNSAEQEHENRQLGGYKAALHNPRTSLEAQTHAAEVLHEHGIEASVPAHQHAHHPGTTHVKDHTHEKEAVHDTRSHAHAHDQEEERKHEHHVVGGYKATLHNPNTSQEAKEHAKEVLKEHGVQE